MTSVLAPEVVEIVARSLAVSGCATAAAMAFALPVSLALLRSESRLARAVIVVSNSFLSVPAVVIGLGCYLLLSRNGPLGLLRLLYTPWAMIAAQAILAFPIILSLTVSGMKLIVKPVGDTILTMGANRFQFLLSLLYEGRRQFFAAAIMGFSRVIGETGMTMMVGGNIKGETRVMTTTIALETMKGNFELAVILGVILLAVAVVINIILNLYVGRNNASWV